MGSSVHSTHMFSVSKFWHQGVTLSPRRTNLQGVVVTIDKTTIIVIVVVFARYLWCRLCGSLFVRFSSPRVVIGSYFCDNRRRDVYEVRSSDGQAGGRPQEGTREITEEGHSKQVKNSPQILT